MLVGYMRVSTSDERQSVDLQRDALLGAGVDERHLHRGCTLKKYAPPGHELPVSQWNLKLQSGLKLSFCQRQKRKSFCQWSISGISVAGRFPRRPLSEFSQFVSA